VIFLILSNRITTTSNARDLEVITCVQRRRHLAVEKKISWVCRSIEPVMTISIAARESGVTPSELFTWRRLLLTDNGSRYTAIGTRAFARAINKRPLTTPVESPQSNGLAESFVKTIKRDYFAFGDLSDAKTVMGLLPSWSAYYNAVHPQSALKFMSPRMFR